MAYQPKSYRKFVATAATATLVASAVAPAALAASSFTDVAPKYKEAVDYLFDNGITQGKTEELFGTHQNITRGELAIWLTRALELETEGAAPSGFEDTAGTYYDAHVSVLKEAGILDGLSADEFGVNAFVTRGQMAKLLSNSYGLTSEEEAPFEDMGQWAPYINGLYAYEITSGKTEELFGTGEAITRGDLAIFMFRADTLPGEEDLVAPEFNYDGETELSIENGAEFVLPEVTATDDVDGELELTPVITDAEGNEVALEDIDTTVAATYTVTYSAVDAAGNEAEDLVLTVVVEEAEVVAPAVESVSAITAKSLQVTFAAPVDDTKAVFEVKKGAVKVNTSDISWNEEKTEATIELAGKLTAGEYTVNVTGLTEEALSDSVTVEDEKVAKIEILSTEAPLVDAPAGVDAGDTDIDDLQVGYRVLNQYGEDITKTTSITTSANNVYADSVNGVVTIVGDFNTTTNKIATFTLIHAQSATTTSATVTAVAEAKVSEVAVKGLYNKDGKALTETTNLSNDLFYVELELKDQYGKVVDSASKMGEVLVTESNSTVVDAASSAQVIEVDGKKKVVVALSGSPKVGENVVTAIATASGKSASYTVKVEESTRAYNVDVAAPEVAVANEVVNVPVTVTDKNGNLVTDLAILKDAARGVKVTVGGVDRTANLIVKDGAVYLPHNFTEGYESIVIISNATQKVDTLTIQVKAEAKPVIVTGLSSNFSTTFKTGQTKTIGAGDLVIEDQYGRVMTEAKINSWLDAAGANEIEITEVEGSTVVAISDAAGDNDIAASGETVSVVAGAAKGTEKITVTLRDANGAIVSSAKDLTLRVTDGSEYTSYEVKSVGTVYDEVAAGKNDAAVYDKSVVVNGILADGSKVRLTAGSDYAVTSTNATLNADVAADGRLDVTSAYTTYGTGSEIKLPLAVTINATGEQFNQEVTISKAAPKVTSLDVVAEGEGADFINGLDVSALDKFNFNATSGGAFTFADLDANADVVATDQYGTSVILTGSSDAFADTSAIGLPTLTFTKVDGNLVFSANGTTSAAVTELPLNSIFNVVLSTQGVALSTSPVKVTVTGAYSASADATAVATAKSALTLTANASDEVVLPATVNGVAVTWTHNGTAATGTVIVADTDTLVATLTKGASTDTKSFTVSGTTGSLTVN